MPQSPAAGASELRQIAEAALRYKFSQYPDPSFSAYVIESGEFNAQELAIAFRGHKPRVVAAIDVENSNAGQIVDKQTGQPVVLWFVEIREFLGNRAMAYVSYHSGSLAAEGWKIHLRRKDGKWIVESEEAEWVS